MMAEIKNVILDLGGVIINIDPMRTIEVLMQKGAENVEGAFMEMEEGGHFDQFERGEISGVEIRKRLNKKLSKPVSDEVITEAWDALLLDIPQERVDTIKALRQQYRVFLLSNTNAPHIATINERVQKEFDILNIREWFDKAYLSFELGLRKPEPEIYRHILQDQQIEAEETIFLDDSLTHLESAKSLGIHTRLVTPEDGLVQIAQRELL